MRTSRDCRTCVAVVLLIVCGMRGWSQAQNPQPRNPLGDLFRQIDRGIRRGAEQIEQAKHGRDQLDLRPLQEPERARRLLEVDALINRERWHDAVEILQSLTDQEQDAFLVEPTGAFSSLHREAEERIGHLPAAGLRNYVNRYGSVSSSMLREAFDEQSEERILEVARRFFHTPAGRSATESLVRLWQDRGEYRAAAAAALKLSEAHSEPGVAAHWNAAAARMFARSGDIQRARSLLDLADADRILHDERFRTRDHVQPLRGTPFTQPAEAVRFGSLSPAWSAQLIERYAVREQLETVIANLREQDDFPKAVLPTIQALSQGTRIAFRTLGGLQVRDARTGTLSWEKRPDENLEAEFSQNGVNANSYEETQLESLLFRDGVYGCLTSDGDRLFAIEKNSILDPRMTNYVWRRQTDVSESQRELWSTNELVAYDIETGSEKWILGGRPIEEHFSHRLAGTYFFAPPVASGRELFVIGERTGEVGLFCLDAETGDLLWFQPLCIPGRSIAEDAVRRFWPCLPAILDDKVICPTTCGWLIAVNRRTRDLTWGYRYARRNSSQRRFGGGMAVQTVQELNRRWAPHMPIPVAGGHVLFTPPELPDEFHMTPPVVVCLNAHSGEEVWKQMKEDGLYLAGVTNELAVIVNRQSVIARKLQTGEIAWRTPFRRSDDLPSGRGVIVGGRLYLPLSDRRLATFELERGELVGEQEIPGEAIRLGNLFVSGGAICSLSNFELVRFQEDSPAQTQTGRIATLADCLQQLRLDLADGKPQDALRAIQTFRARHVTGDLSPTDVDTIERAEWDVLVEIVPHESEADVLLSRLAHLAMTLDRKATYDRLWADRLQRQGAWSEALTAYLQLLDRELDSTESSGEDAGGNASSSENSLRFVPDDNCRVRLDCWIGGRLRDLYRTLDSSQRQQFSSRLQGHLNSIGRSDVERRAYRSVLAFHSLGHELDLALADDAVLRGDIAEAILRYQRVTRSAEQSLAGTAWVRLAELYSTQGFLSDALIAYKTLQSLGDIRLPKIGSVASVTAEGIRACRQAFDAAPRPESPWGKRWIVDWAPKGRDRAGRDAVPHMGSVPDFVDNLQFLVRRQSQRLHVEDAQSGEMVWSFPLRSLSELDHNPHVGVMAVGPLAFVMHHGVVHALRFPDHRIGWTYTPRSSSLTVSRLRTPSRPLVERMRSMDSLKTASRLDAYRAPAGYLLAATPDVVLLLEQDLIALDPLSGSVMWRISDIDSRSVAHLMGEDLLVISPGTSGRLLRWIDGAEQPETGLEHHYENSIGILDQQLIVLDRQAAQVRAISTTDGQDQWTTPVPEDSLLSFDKTSEIRYLNPQGTLHTIDLQTGRGREIGVVPENLMQIKKRVYLLEDESCYYVFVAHGRSQPVYLNIPSIRTTGTILAFDREGGLLWSQDVSSLGNHRDRDALQDERQWSLSLLVQEFERSPVLVFVGDRPEHLEDLYFRRLKIISLDKRTGKLLVDWERISDSSGFSSFHIDIGRAMLCLDTYNERIRIRATDETLPESGESE